MIGGKVLLHQLPCCIAGLAKEICHYLSCEGNVAGVV